MPVLKTLPKQISLWDLNLFFLVAKWLSFNRAAQEIHVNSIIDLFWRNLPPLFPTSDISSFTVALANAQVAEQTVTVGKMRGSNEWEKLHL